MRRSVAVGTATAAVTAGLLLAPAAPASAVTATVDLADEIRQPVVEDLLVLRQPAAHAVRVPRG